MIERYLRLHLAANLDRPQTVRHSRDALRRLVHWLTSTHPEITNRDQLHRAHAEEFLRWFGEQTSQHTGVPLALTTRRSVITLLTRFVNETAAWHWTDVPGRVLFTRSDIPKIPRSLPRFIPDHELAALMNGSRPTARPLPAGSADRRPCECDLVLTCSKFLTTSNYAPRLHARLAVEQQLIEDATARGWQREIERHTATQHRIEQLLQDLDDPDDPKLHPPHGHRSAKPPGCPSSAAPEATLADPDLSR